MPWYGWGGADALNGAFVGSLSTLTRPFIHIRQQEAVGGGGSSTSTSVGASSRSTSGTGRSRMGSQDSGGGSQSRFLSRAVYIEAETLKQQQGGGGAGSALPEWLAVAEGRGEGVEGPN